MKHQDNPGTDSTFTITAPPDQSPDSRLLPDETAILTTFRFGKWQSDIYHSTVSSGKPVEAGQLAKLNWNTRPRAILYTDEIQKGLAKAFSKRPAKGIDAASETLLQMEFPVDLINDCVRFRASESIRQQLGESVPLDNIKLWPFWQMEAYATIGTQSVFIGRSPALNLKTTTFTAPAHVNTELTATLSGTETELREFAQNPKVQLQWWVSGFTIKQNSVEFVMKNLAQSAYRHALTGGADFSAENSSKTWRAGGGFSFGPITIGGGAGNERITWKQKSWVTRDQVKVVLMTSNWEVSGRIWEEFPRDTAFDSLLDKAVTELLNRAHAKTVLFDSKGDLLADKELLEDLKPDVVAQLAADVKSRCKLVNEQKLNATTPKGNITDERKSDIDCGADIAGSRQGSTIIPKSLRLFQFNEGNFKDVARVNWVHTQASKGMAPLSDDSQAFPSSDQRNCVRRATDYANALKEWTQRLGELESVSWSAPIHKPKGENDGGTADCKRYVAPTGYRIAKVYGKLAGRVYSLGFEASSADGKSVNSGLLFTGGGSASGESFSVTTPGTAFLYGLKVQTGDGNGIESISEYRFKHPPSVTTRDDQGRSLNHGGATHQDVGDGAKEIVGMEIMRAGSAIDVFRVAYRLPREEWENHLKQKPQDPVGCCP